MSSKWRLCVLSLFLIGLILIGMVGTSASLTFLWPVYGLIGLVAAFSVGLILEDTRFTLPRAATISLLALCGYLLARATDSPVSYFAREDASLLVLSFLAYGLFFILLGTAPARRRLVDALAILVGIHLLFALLQAFVSPKLWLLPGYERTFTDRPGGLFNHPDHFGGFLAILVPVWLASAVYSRRPRPVRIAAACLSLLSIFAILLWGGGAAWLALAGGVAGFLVLSLVILHRRMNTRSKKAGWKLLAVASLALLVVALGAAGPIGRLIDRTVLTKSGELSLPLVWKAGMQQISESPFVGTGSRTSYLYGRLYRDEALNSSSTEPEFIHNEFLQMVADYGLVGLALLLAMLGLHAHQGLKFIRAYAAFPPAPSTVVPRSDHLALVTGAMASLFAMTVLACFDFVLHLPVFAFIGAIFLAVLAVPDPMAGALQAPSSGRLLPGGAMVFLQRSLVFGCGLAMMLFGFVFSRSEYHYEMARRAFEADRSGFQHLRHLHTARLLDPKNPFLFTLSAHAQIAGILPEMPEPARRDALEKADFYFSHARGLYPQDIFAAIGHAAVLDELGRPGDALLRLREAREMAPHYGNLLLAEGEHFLRHGRVEEAEKAFSEAVSARAFRDTAAAQQGLRTLTEWKLIAEQNGIDWRIDPDPRDTPPLLAGTYEESRSPAEAQVAGRELAGQALGANPATDTEGPFAAKAEPAMPTAKPETVVAPASSGIETPILFHGPPKPAVVAVPESIEPSPSLKPDERASRSETAPPSDRTERPTVSLFNLGNESGFSPLPESAAFYLSGPDLFAEPEPEPAEEPAPAP